MMKRILVIIFVILFLVNYAPAQTVQNLEEFIYKNTNVKKSSFKSKEVKIVKLVTFSDLDFKIRFLVIDDVRSIHYIIPVRIEKLDTLISFGQRDFDKSLAAETQEKFKLTLNECFTKMEQPEKCIRTAIVNVIASSSDKAEFKSQEFLDKMMKMGFEVKNMNIEIYSYYADNEGAPGCHARFVDVYLFENKPIGLFISGWGCQD